MNHARIHWDENGLPLSQAFDDVYFSKESGLEETLHNFIGQNRLVPRFEALAGGECLVIGETGFGTGLNFLCAWELFEAHAPQDARLHFISVEKFPLSRVDLARAIALWPTLAPWGQALLAQYRVIEPGFQQLRLAGGRVTLTLLVGDVQTQLPLLDAQVHAWFLDGFAPAKNPDMWTPALFAELARLSAPGATLGTFTAAGVVRRGLMAEGFAMERVPGYGRKREIMRGVYEGASPLENAPPPWFDRPPVHQGERHALVVGAGLAGCATAASLAARGWRVTLLERQATLATAASGNPQGVLYLKLSAHGTALSKLILSGFGYTRRLLENLQAGSAWQRCGVLQLAYDDAEAKRQARLTDVFDTSLLQSLSRDQATEVAGVEVPQGGLFYPDAGWVHPPALCQWLAAHPGITLAPHNNVLRLEREHGLWCAFDNDRRLAQAPIAVLANAEDAARLTGLPLKPIRGQITRLPVNGASASLRTVVCADGYLAPGRDGEHTLGASFDFERTDLTPSEQEHQGNLLRLRELAPGLAQQWRQGPGQLEGRVGLRCTTPDYLPVVGPIANREAFDVCYEGLARNARLPMTAPCPWASGLFINSGHGSRGLITAPLSGELLAAWMCGEPLPVPREVAEACHPQRFALRALKKARPGP